MIDKKVKLTVRISAENYDWLHAQEENPNKIIRAVLEEAMEKDGSLEAKKAIARSKSTQAKVLLEEALRLLEMSGQNDAHRYTRKALESITL